MATKQPAEGYVDIIDSLVSSIYKAIIDDWLNRDIKCAEYKELVRTLYSRHAWETCRLSWRNDRGRYNNILTNVFNRLNAKIRNKQRRHRISCQTDELEAFLLRGATSPEERWYEEMRPFMALVHHDICPIDGLPHYDPTDI